MNKATKECKKEREGLCFISKYGESYVIMKYNNAKDVEIKFENGYEKSVHWGNIKNDAVISPYAKRVYNVGFIGEGKYSSSDEQGNITIEYEEWRQMIRRCYEPYLINKFPTYIYATVCEEWLNFQNFAEWYEKEKYKCNKERLALDKDILIKGNKIYSPETCMLVPERINSLFVKADATRGLYPIGCNINKNNKLMVRCNTPEGRVYLGQFPLNKPFQAFTCYKQFKENYIKQVADEYKDLIPQKLYEAMYNYQVEIND